VLSFAL